MSRKLKVWGACFDGTTRNIVAAPTKRAAADAFGVTLYAMNEWASDTGNPVELSVALARPGTPFSAPENRNSVEDYIAGLHRYRRGRPWPPAA